MRRMTLWILLAVTMMALALGGPAFAQDANSPATIITFTSSLPFISVADLEAGTTSMTLNWFVVGLGDDERLVLDRYELSGFVSMLEPDETALPASGSREVTLSGLTGFAPPTYRLAILDFRNRILDQQTVTVNYIAPAQDEATTVEFSADAETLVPTALAAGNARVAVTWNITNRPPTANPVFEQVLPGGEAINVELARDFLWVPSAGSGAVAPVSPETGSEIELRLRVVDLVNGTVYGEDSVILSTGGGAAPDATTDTTDAVTTEESADSGASIVSFTATPETVPLGESVQLSWTVTGASSVQISMRMGTSIQQELIAGNLPLRAGLMIPVTEDLYGDVGSLTFIIRPVDAAGNSLGLGRADVTIGPPTPVEPVPIEPATEEAEATVEALG